jgi:hypothetical protein
MKQNYFFGFEDGHEALAGDMSKQGFYRLDTIRRLLYNYRVDEERDFTLGVIRKEITNLRLYNNPQLAKKVKRGPVHATFVSYEGVKTILQSFLEKGKIKRYKITDVKNLLKELVER